MQYTKFPFKPNMFLSERITELSLENQRLTCELKQSQEFRSNQAATIEAYQRTTRELQSELACARRLNWELRQRNEELRQRLACAYRAAQLERLGGYTERHGL